MRIIAAAVKYKGLTFSMPAPARHADILRALHPMHEDAAILCEQGFLADNGVFYGRRQAKWIVRDYGQPTIRSSHTSELFSEDLW